MEADAEIQNVSPRVIRGGLAGCSPERIRPNDSDIPTISVIEAKPVFVQQRKMSPHSFSPPRRTAGQQNLSFWIREARSPFRRPTPATQRTLPVPVIYADVVEQSRTGVQKRAPFRRLSPQSRMARGNSPTACAAPASKRARGSNTFDTTLCERRRCVANNNRYRKIAQRYAVESILRDPRFSTRQKMALVQAEIGLNMHCTGNAERDFEKTLCIATEKNSGVNFKAIRDFAQRQWLAVLKTGTTPPAAIQIKKEEGLISPQRSTRNTSHNKGLSSRCISPNCTSRNQTENWGMQQIKHEKGNRGLLRNDFKVPGEEQGEEVIIESDKSASAHKTSQAPGKANGFLSCTIPEVPELIPLKRNFRITSSVRA